MYGLSPIMAKLQPLGQIKPEWLLILCCKVDTLTSNSKLCYNDSSVDKQMSLCYSMFTYNLQSQTKTLNHFGKISLRYAPRPLLRCSGKGKCISVSRIFSEDCSLHQQLMTIFFYFFFEEILRWSRQGQREIHVGVGSLSENGYLQKFFEEASRKKEKKLATLVLL